MVVAASHPLSGRINAYSARREPALVEGKGRPAVPVLERAPYSVCPSQPAMARFPLAAIVHAQGDPVDELLIRFAFDLRASGWEIAGLVHWRRGPDKNQTVLLDVASGRCYPLFQRLGSGSTACSLDPAGIAAASLSLREALACSTDLVLANRFGALEAAGGGLADEMLALMSVQRPLLTAVSEAQLSAWRRFTGGYGNELIAARWALEEWFFTLQYGHRHGREND